MIMFAYLPIFSVAHRVRLGVLHCDAGHDEVPQSLLGQLRKDKQVKHAEMHKAHKAKLR